MGPLLRKGSGAFKEPSPQGRIKLKDCVSIFAHIRIIFLFNVVLRKYVPKIKGAKVLEVGSAPGDFLVTLNKVYGFIPLWS
jgi:hypothetical protein